MQQIVDQQAVYQQHLNDLHRQADNQRLARLALANQANRKFRQPLLAVLGRQLSKVGQRLEQAATSQTNEVLAYGGK